MSNDINIKRRQLLKTLLALGFTASQIGHIVRATELPLITRTIPSSGEKIPAVGMGTSRTFDALDDTVLQKQLKEVLQIFFDKQGTLIDSSPMYASAEAVVGILLKQLSNSDKLFAATKVWTFGKQEGILQMEASRELWGIKRFDLMQIHNLRDWKTHYPTLVAMKAEGKIRYIGVTTSHGRFHDELSQLLKTKQFDFLQLSYNILDREVENKLLPIAQDRGIAVIVNRPYQRGDLFSEVREKKLPDFAKDYDIHSWAQYFLKFIISHPAVTCVIPATTNTKHLIDNMAAQFGRLPDKKIREKMIKAF